MQIREAQQIYRGQLQAVREQRDKIVKRQEEMKKQMELFPQEQEKEGFEEEAATLELSMEALTKKQEEYQSYLDSLAEQWCLQANAESSRQQADAMKEYGADMAKIMEVARRIMKGGIVPAQDEKKLMEYSTEMYQMAKNIGAMAREKKEKYESLWEEKEEKEYEDPMEVADSAQAQGVAPAIEDFEVEW